MRIRRVAKRDNDVGVVKKIAAQVTLDELRKFPKAPKTGNIFNSGGGGGGFGVPLPTGEVPTLKAVAYITGMTTATVVAQTYLVGKGAVHLYDDAADDQIHVRLNLINDPLMLVNI